MLYRDFSWSTRNTSYFVSRNSIYFYGLEKKNIVIEHLFNSSVSLWFIPTFWETLAWSDVRLWLKISNTHTNTHTQNTHTHTWTVQHIYAHAQCTIQYGLQTVSLVKSNPAFRISSVSPMTEEFNNFKIETKQTGEGKVSHIKGNASLIIL